MIKFNMTTKEITSEFIKKYKIDDTADQRKVRNKIYHKVNEVITKDLELKGHPINSGKHKEYTPEQVKEIERHMKQYLRDRSIDEEIRNPFTPSYVEKLRKQYNEQQIEEWQEQDEYHQYLMNSGVEEPIINLEKCENELKLDAIFNIFYKDFDKKKYYKDLMLSVSCSDDINLPDDVIKAREKLKQPELYYFTRR